MKFCGHIQLEGNGRILWMNGKTRATSNASTVHEFILTKQGTILEFGLSAATYSDEAGTSVEGKVSGSEVIWTNRWISICDKTPFGL